VGQSASASGKRAAAFALGKAHFQGNLVRRAIRAVSEERLKAVNRALKATDWEIEKGVRGNLKPAVGKRIHAASADIRFRRHTAGWRKSEPGTAGSRLPTAGFSGTSGCSGAWHPSAGSAGGV